MAERSVGEDRSGFPIVPNIVALFDDLVGKPARQPVTSLHRLLFFALNTTFDFTYDLVNSTLPDWTSDTPVPPLSHGPGMDLVE